MSLVTPPATWQADFAQATELSEKANAVTHYGAERSLATVEVYRPLTEGAALIVTAIAAKISNNREVAARMAVDELHATTKRAALAGSRIVEGGWQERVDTAAKQIEATLMWSDTDAGTTTHARLLVVADGENLVTVTGECVDTHVLAAPSACERALATLDPGIALGKRVVLALAPAGTEAPLPDKPSTMSDGSRTPMPPMTLPSEKHARDRRPVYVGAGLVLLAAAFWWNQRRKQK